MRIWVAGGTSGIGKAIADKLQTYEHHSVHVTGEKVDVRKPVTINTMDALIYSVGVNYLDTVENVNTDRMLDLYDVNVVGLIRCIQASPLLRRVVVIGSDAGWRPMRTSVAYCASKAALHMAVKVIAREKAADDFAINVIAPGMTQYTKMQEYVDQRVMEIRGWTEDEMLEYEQSYTPMKRRLNPDEVAEVACQVLFTETSYMTGSIIPVNGAR